MPQEINVTKEDIRYAESILLPEGIHFNEERIAYIKSFETLDLQAVPGSGKTTALLAKLLILERKLPFEDGSGILILSHTNSAIDEIKHKLVDCHKIFNYPNFIGTIQSFVDEFLAIPCFQMLFKKKVLRIDNQIYAEMVDKYMSRSLQGFSAQSQRDAKYFLNGNNCQHTYRLKVNNNGEVILVKSINGKELEISKPRRAKVYIDFTTDEKDAIKSWLINFKHLIMGATGALHFDDAYYLAEKYIYKIPEIVQILQKRFPYVFVDEMQDMDTHQYDLLEKLFYVDGASESIIQRIGDKNQAIYNSVKAGEVWQDRPQIKRLGDSLRLSNPIANVVSNFALHRDEHFVLNGINPSSIKPHLLLYEDATVTQVIPYFSELVMAFRDSGDLTDFGRYPIKVVAWNTDWKDEDNAGKIRLVDYHKEYSREKSKPKTDYPNLKSHLLYYEKNTLRSIQHSIVNGVLKVFRLENIVYGDKIFTKTILFDTLKLNHPDRYEEFKLLLFNCSIQVIKGEVNIALEGIRVYLPQLCALFSTNAIKNSRDFIDDESESTNDEIAGAGTNDAAPNEILMEITSVHAVKGQTHCATLYLESYYQKDGNGATAKSYESQRLVNPFLGTPLNAANIGERVKQSAKMAFVGLSRPTNFLCVAVHKKHFEAGLSSINRDAWEIKVVPAPIPEE